MSEKFEREERYIVFKVKDLSEHKLGWVRDVIRLNGIPTVDAVVVESDWPEYEPTWAAIERRVTGAPAWVGIGPPPAGTVCEIRNVAAGSDWAEATIMFASRNVVVWDWVGEPPFNGLCTAYAHTVEMRPVRTPEQIAAEDREKAVEPLAYEIAGYHGFDDPRDVDIRLAEHLYDQNFRKRVAS